MEKAILITGPNLDPSAAKLVEEHGFKAFYTPAYAESDVISEHLRESGAVGIVSRLGRLDASVMDAAPQLRVISKHGVGVDNIDVAAATERGIPVLVAPGENAVSVAEHAIALLLASVKRLLPLDTGLRAGRWEKPGFAGRELAGATFSLMGMGSIAQATGRFAKCLGMQLAGFDPYAKDDVFEKLGVYRCKSYEELLKKADILSLHCPLNDQTRSMVNATAIASMPKGSYIINTARGGLIDEAALLEAIQSGHLAGAGLDTFATEPPGSNHPFWAEPRIVATPHIAGVTKQANARVGIAAVRGIIQFLGGESIDPERIVNHHQLADTIGAVVKK